MSKKVWDIIEEQTSTAKQVGTLQQALDSIWKHAPTAEAKADLFKIVAYAAKSPEAAAQVRAALALRADATAEEAPGTAPIAIGGGTAPASGTAPSGTAPASGSSGNG